jgi:ribonuclease Z
MQRLFQISRDANDFDKLFLTHLHSDHTTGIPDMWITGRLCGRLDNPLRIWGQEGTVEMVHHIEEAFKVDTTVRSEARVHDGNPWDVDGPKIEPSEIDEGYVYEENGVKVIPFRVDHHIHSQVPSYGYRVEYKGHSVVISGDTCYCENLVKYSQGADLLVHEVAAAPLADEVPEGIRFVLAHHTVPEDCGNIFSKADPKLAVYNHIIQFMGVTLEEIMTRTTNVYSGPVVIGEDMMKIEIGDSIQVFNP